MDAQFAQILRRFAESQKLMAQAIERRDADLSAWVSEELTALYEMVEMSFYVSARANIEGLYHNAAADDPDDMLRVFNRLSELQNEYLATVSVASFLGKLGSQDG